MPPAPPISRLAFPAMLVAAPLAILWIYARYFYATADSWHDLSPGLFLGWLIAAFLLATLASILAAGSHDSTLHAIFSAAIAIHAVALLLLLITATTRLVSWQETLRLYLLLLTWCAPWFVFTAFFSRFSATLAIVASLTLSTFLIAAPVSAVPVARAVARYGHDPYDKTLTAISYATPVLPAFEAVKNSLPAVAGWPERKLMYRYSDLGQEIALRAQWHIAVLVYLAAAFLVQVFASCSRLLYRSPKKPLPPS